MIRKIITIDEEKCNGCGLCVTACHEGAIGLINGKAQLLRDDYCDGLGDCLPTCPTQAISFVEREAAAYDDIAVKKHQASKKISPSTKVDSHLLQWPVQIKLAPINAPYFQNADLLIAADCTSYAYGNFHNDFMINRVTLIGCPKLDAVDYSEKLTDIIRNNDIHSLTVVRMEVPCCGGMEYAVQIALQHSRKQIPLKIITLSTDGKILN